MIESQQSTHNTTPTSFNISQLAEKLAQNNASSLSGKSYFEILAGGLESYTIIPGFSAVSLFLLDMETFSFDFKLSHPWEAEPQELEKFKTLNANGALTEVLNTNKPVHSIDNSSKESYLTIPLITENGIIGIVILTGSGQQLNDELIAIITIWSNQFALSIHAARLHAEVKNLDENLTQIIALRTKDIARSTLEVKYILNSVAAGIMLIDKRSGKITDANGKAAEIIGMQKDKIVGLRSSEFFFEKEIKKRGEIVTNQESTLKRNNGNIIPVIHTRAEIKLEDAEYYIESFFDITERKALELELRNMKDSLEQRVKERTHDLVMTNRELISEIDRRKKAEEDLHKFFWAVQQNPVMISLANAEGIIEFVNPRFSEITGYLFKEAIGKNLHFLRTIDESHDTFPEIWQTVSSGGIWSGEHTNRKKNGEVYWVSTLISPIINQEGIVSHYLAVQEDITLKKEAVRQTIIAKEKAEESDRLKTTILANMSHEFRTPLIGILGFAQILLEEIIDESQADLVGEIEKSGNRLMRTLDSILFLSQLESGNIHESSTVLNPTDIVIRIYEQLTETAAAKGISFTINCMDEELHTKGVDEMLTMAFTHLIDNALKFTKAGSVEISISKRESEIGAQFVSVAVKDTGIGIPQEALELIFEPFRQYSEGYTRTYQGTGLGLTLARKIIELHGGHLEVSSMVGEGSVFTALLPIS